MYCLHFFEGGGVVCSCVFRLLQLLNLLMMNCLFRRDTVFKVLNKVTKEIHLQP
jgi:hypothetical protein